MTNILKEVLPLSTYGDCDALLVIAAEVQIMRETMPPFTTNRQLHAALCGVIKGMTAKLPDAAADVPIDDTRNRLLKFATFCCLMLSESGLATEMVAAAEQKRQESLETD